MKRSNPCNGRFLAVTFGGALALVVGLWSTAGTSRAQESAPAPALTPEKAAAYVALAKEEVELAVQQRLFTMLAEERHGRSEAAQKEAKGELAKWEADLSRELQARSAEALKKLDEATQRRQAFEDANKLAGPPRPEVLTGWRPWLLGAEEVVYLQRIDQRLGLLQSELASLQETQRLYVLELQTNNTPDDVSRVSWMLEGSNRDMRDLQRQQSDLQLKKLEFRALRAGH